MKHVASLVLACIAVFAFAPVASAHGQREVGEVSWTVGWADEPAFIGFKNAVQLRLERDGEPVELPDGALQVAVSLGDQTSEPFPMEAAFGSPGEYLADVIPTAPGDYTFRFTGTVAGQEVDESWTGSEDGFDEARSTDDVAFPNPAPANSELADRIEAVDADIESLNTSTPLVASIAALVIAVVALGGSAMRRRESSS